MKTVLENMKLEVYEIFDYLHTHPEISWEEKNTTDYLTTILERYGYKTTRFDDCTGVIGEKGKGDFTVGLRADIDALWQEVDGEMRANHSCGHDAHMTTVIGTMILLDHLSYCFPGKIKIIFQPAEEKGNGALTLVNKGLVDDVDYLYGLHVRPFQEVEDGKASPAILHGAARTIEGKIKGEDSHGARPHLGPNAIEVATSIVNQLNAIHINPMVPHSVKMTQMNTLGGSPNIIPGSATFGLDVRAQTNEVMEELGEKIELIRSSLSKFYGVDIFLETKSNVAAAIENVEAQSIMSEAIKEAVGDESLVPTIITPGGEDFHFYTLKRPKIKATMLGLGCDLRPGLHHPKMTFNREALLKGIEIMTRAVITTFDKYEKEIDINSHQTKEKN